MPGNEREAVGEEEASRGQQKQQPKQERTERGQTCPLHDDHTSPPPPTLCTSPQAFSFCLGSLAPFMRTSQLQTQILQQCAGDEVSKQFLQFMTMHLEESQQRPTVLRRGTPQMSQGSDPNVMRKANESLREAYSQQAEQSSQHTRNSQQPRSHSPQPRSHSPQPKSSPTGPVGLRKSVIITQARALFVNGGYFCRWPGCEEMFDDYPHFLNHLHREHSPGERSLAQCRVQQDMVQHMENQLALERQKLLAMQLHLSVHARHIPSSPKEGPEGPHDLLMDLPQSQATAAAPYCASNDAAEVVRQGYWHMSTSHLIPEIGPSTECYKYTNIRPPFTYASLIRWAILEAPEKQLSLNQIYHWFTRMFFYFRHNTTTWKSLGEESMEVQLSMEELTQAMCSLNLHKAPSPDGIPVKFYPAFWDLLKEDVADIFRNAVRHNLSLHRCFVRMERGKGAVWTVDETEFQKRKGQKFNRDHDVGCLFPYTFCPPQSWPGGRRGHAEQSGTKT